MAEKKGMLTEESGKLSSTRVISFIVIFLLLMAAGIAMVLNHDQGQPVTIPDIPDGWLYLVAILMGSKELAKGLKRD